MISTAQRSPMTSMARVTELVAMCSATSDTGAL
jgi:hypothetical protein